MPLTTTKEDHLQVRLDADAKSVLERAATYRFETVSQFVLSTALTVAEDVIRENEAREPIVLSATDWKIFCEAMDNPRPPNETLRAAYAKYLKSVSVK
jgi:uncharacterized protein (DUF1778 family)